MICRSTRCCRPAPLESARQYQERVLSVGPVRRDGDVRRSEERHLQTDNVQPLRNGQTIRLLCPPCRLLSPVLSLKPGHRAPSLPGVRTASAVSDNRLWGCPLPCSATGAPQQSCPCGLLDSGSHLYRRESVSRRGDKTARVRQGRELAVPTCPRLRGAAGWR